MKIRDKSTLIISILIPLAVGTMSALFSGNMSSYSILTQPAFSPPGFIFPVVWTILYILMGASSYIVYSSNSPNKSKALLLYCIQLFFNFCWSIIFFGLDLFLFAFIWLIALILIVNPLSAYLQIPYLIWCIFAAYLNFSIFLLN
ncbi:TspO/MBR family protein [Enterocloster clostridioformis]|uniref:TspO and MBR-like protein n=1 Tax=Enterocloster clostridioformis TaxID=1531 RepID=A0A174PXG0_9FIRM|nr:TspO/MBR family protein [Enterocloster clostridioformis]CUP64306.1 TspO and MBR-like protein [Enterocloster clostridioformis]